jgi:asparagine synthase (glutamine-hydrolysing)
VGHPERFAEGPLLVTWNAADDHSFYSSEQVACLLEGSLYEIAGTPAAGSGREHPARALAELYLRVGEDGLSRVRGEYWALLWDRRRRCGAIVTDQMGARSPYFTRAGGTLIAASEVRQVMSLLPATPGPEPVALAHWLMITAPPDEMTLFSGVYRLPAAHLLAIDESPHRPRRYWAPVYRPPLQEASDQLAGTLRECLTEAVARRLGDGRPAGVRLSGGIDSSVVTALASLVKPELRTYSATFPAHPTIDESEQIERTVEHLKLRSIRAVVRGGSVLAGALDYLDEWRMPPSSPNLFFWMPLFDRAAADGVRVMLDGEGGDEVFGFSPYLLADLLRRGRIAAVWALIHRWPSGLPATRGRIAFRLREFALKGALPPVAHTLRRRARGGQGYSPEWMPESLAASWLASERATYTWKRLPGPRWWAFLVHLVTGGAGPALVYEQTRRMAAQAGLDARHPLVDVDVIELMLTIPPALGFDPRVNRPLLRQSVAGLLPDAVRLRPQKSSFDALFHEVLAGPERPVASRLLDPATAELRAYIDMEKVQRELLAADPPRDQPALQSWALRVWRLLTAECWLRSQRDETFTTSLREREQLSRAHLDLLDAGPGARPLPIDGRGYAR